MPCGWHWEHGDLKPENEAPTWSSKLHVPSLLKSVLKKTTWLVTIGNDAQTPKQSKGNENISKIPCFIFHISRKVKDGKDLVLETLCEMDARR